MVIRVLFTVTTLLTLIACNRVKQNELDTNFSFAVCPSTTNIQVTPFLDQSGKTSVNISCQTSSLQLSQNVGLIIYSDGNISIAPIESGRIKISDEEYLIKTISLLHQGGEVKSIYKGTPGQTQDLVSFPEKTTIADITLASSIKQDNLLYQIFDLSLSSLLGETETKGIERKNIIFFSSHFSVKNLSNIPFLIFDGLQLYSLRNYKISDVILNFPENITLPNGTTSIIISPTNSISDIDFITPPFLPITIIPDINFSSIQILSESKSAYQFEITQNQISIPIFLTSIDNQRKINIIGESGNNLYFGKLENLTQTTAFMEVFPPSESDVETTINFVFPESLTEEVSFELYPKNRAGSFLMYKDKISKEGKRNLKIRIPKDLISDLYYVKTYTEKKQKMSDNIETYERFERYEISEKPSVYYVLFYPQSENFSFEVEISESKILLSLLAPQKFPIDNLSVNPQPECVLEDLKGKYISRDCISSYVEIYGTDDEGKYQSVWKIYNLETRKNASLPNLFENKELLFELLEAVPKIKIREISFKYIVFAGNTILSYTKGFRYDGQR